MDLLNACFAPKEDIRVYSCPITSNKLNGIFVGTIVRPIYPSYGINMKVFLRCTSIAMFYLFSLLPTTLCAQNSGIEQDEETKMCRYGANHLIEVAKPSLSDPRSRPEQIKKRRKLIEDWSSRLEKGENPCIVYEDMQKAATTF